MKKKSIGISVVVLAVVIGMMVFFDGRNTLIHMDNKLLSSGDKEVSSECSFRVMEDTEVTIRYKMEIGVGEIDIILKDEKDNVILKVEDEGKGKEKMILPPGAYSVRAESDYFDGAYRISVKK